MRTRKGTAVWRHGGPHDQMQVAGVKGAGDSAAGFLKTVATGPMRQSPDSAHWLRPNDEGAV